MASTVASLGTNNSALAYAPDGTLYVVQGNYLAPSSTIEVLNPDGTLGTPLVVDNASFGSVGGAAWDPTTAQLLVTTGDNGSALYSVSVTGALSAGHVTVSALTIFSDPTNTSVPYIAQVAVRPSTGDIFVSDAPFGGADLFQIDRSTGQVHAVAQVDHDFTAGIGFDSQGHVVFQAGQFDFSGSPPTAELAEAALSGSGNGTTAGTPQTLGSNLASFDLAVTLGDHTLLTGELPQSSDGGASPYTSGLFQPDVATNSTHSIVTFPTSTSGDFGSSLSYLPGSTDFTAFSGAAGGRVAFILSDYSGTATGTPGSNVVMIVSPVPEPASWILLAAGTAGLWVCRRRVVQTRRRRMNC